MPDKSFRLRADRKEKKLKNPLNIEKASKDAENYSIMHSTRRLKRRKSEHSTVTKCVTCDELHYNKSKKIFLSHKED